MPSSNKVRKVTSENYPTDAGKIRSVLFCVQLGAHAAQAAVQVPQTVGAFFMSLNMPAWAIALIFDVLILMIGTFIDVSPAILLLTPILLPVMVQYGFSPLQFGAMMITGLAIGLVTPPVGMCLNACNKINRMPIIEIFKGAAPYVICNVIVLISISLWGPLTTALPQLLGYSIF